jgi:hypothetical protein
VRIKLNWVALSVVVLSVGLLLIASLAALCGRSRGGKARFLVAVIELCECACAARVSLFG